MTSFLFVCTGNICRSPTAEAIFRAEVKKRGLEEQIVKINSAGTHGYHVGESPDMRAIDAAKLRGFSMEGMTARQVQKSDYADYDYIVAMDRGHQDILDDMKPENSKAQVVLFMDYCRSHTQKDVPDPYYGGLDGFQRVLDIIEDGVEGILGTID